MPSDRRMVEVVTLNGRIVELIVQVSKHMNYT